jgi:hypothetical protein
MSNRSQTTNFLFTFPCCFCFAFTLSTTEIRTSCGFFLQKLEDFLLLFFFTSHLTRPEPKFNDFNPTWLFNRYTISSHLIFFKSTSQKFSVPSMFDTTEIRPSRRLFRHFLRLDTKFALIPRQCLFHISPRAFFTSDFHLALHIFVASISAAIKERQLFIGPLCGDL